MHGQMESRRVKLCELKIECVVVEEEGFRIWRWRDNDDVLKCHHHLFSLSGAPRGGVVQCSADVVLRPLKAMLHNKAKRDKTERIL
jgi:hypothetical protein